MRKSTKQVTGYRILQDGQWYDVQARDPKEARKFVKELISANKKNGKRN